MKYFSMFSGIGGFEYGIQQAFNNRALGDREQSTEKINLQHQAHSSDSSGSLGNGRWELPECVGYSEIDKYAIKVYERNFNGHTNYGDATKINPKELPDFDLLVGGFPCQAFSIAGKRRGFDDTRGTLFFDIARILAEKKPKHLVLENVKGLLSHDQGRTFQTILGVLANLGYRVEWQVLNSKDFGVPQNRERIIIVGHLGGFSGRKVFPITGTNNKNPIIRTLRAGGAGSTTEKHARDLVAVRQPLRYLNRNQKNIEGDYAYTVDASQTSGVRQDIRIRRLTPKECERLQGFPDNWTAGESDTQRYKMCGNAVTTNVIQAVMEKLL